MADTERPKPQIDPETGRFVSGNIGGPGRKKGARNKLGEAFVADLLTAWESSGKEAIERVISEKPADFLKVVAGLLPKHVEVKNNALEDLADDELASLLAVAKRIAGSGAVEAAGKGKAKASRRKPSGGVSTLQ